MVGDRLDCKSNCVFWEANVSVVAVESEDVGSGGCAVSVEAEAGDE